jgi:kynureninase
MDSLLAYRDRFPILADCVYLINHSLAAMPAQAEENLLEYARMWRERGIRSWGEGWWDMPVTVGDQIGRIIGAPPGSTVMHQNVTVAEEVVLSCFRDPGARNRIVYEDANFPSVRYLYQAKPDLDVVTCESDEQITAAIDERTLLVPISHVLFKNAEIQDVEPIIARAHEMGAYGPFAFEPELEYADGARRFLTGTPNVPALYVATAGYDVIEEVGVERIRERSLALTHLLIDELDAAGFEIGSPREERRRGGTVLVRTPDHAAVHRELGERGIICDFRPDAGVRLGPHFYNSEDELRHTVAELADIVATGAYTRHADAVANF